MKLGICREEVSQEALNEVRGIENHERLDEELYHDFETEDLKKAGGGNHVRICASTTKSYMALHRNGLPRRPRSLKGWRKRTQRSQGLHLCEQLTLHILCTTSMMNALVQKGGSAAELESKKRELQAKRAIAASQKIKSFYKVTVKVGGLSRSNWYCCQVSGGQQDGAIWLSKAASGLSLG